MSKASKSVIENSQVAMLATSWKSFSGGLLDAAKAGAGLVSMALDSAEAIGRTADQAGLTATALQELGMQHSFPAFPPTSSTRIWRRLRPIARRRGRSWRLEHRVERLWNCIARLERHTPFHGRHPGRCGGVHTALDKPAGSLRIATAAFGADGAACCPCCVWGRKASQHGPRGPFPGNGVGR